MKHGKKNEIADILKKHNHFIISSHMHLDGDAVGSELALYLILKQLKKDVRIINQDKAPDVYDFLPCVQEILCSEDFAGKDFHEVRKYKILIVLDSSNLERIGNIGIETSQFDFIINIDHHASNSFFGKYNYINTDVSSVGEIIFAFAKLLKTNISLQIAIPLYAAIVTDTGSFRYANTKAATFKIAHQLVQLGVNPSYITNYIYNNYDLSSLRLLGEALVNIKLDPSLRISWTVISRETLCKTNAKDEESEGIVDKILSIKKVLVSVLFRETKDGHVKISFRSKGNFNVDKFAGKFGGGGHPNAAGCQLIGAVHEVCNTIISELQKELNLIS
ncbi:MAG: bifunctional oligoribonuclease/PAP phosphatase NrnA [Candidatus Atribacteria bacterium]|nr:bifunctional oligoribonuclease/PAP phosphatase NrnA [Candidatus Atribacteria bacterium]